VQQVSGRRFRQNLSSGVCPASGPHEHSNSHNYGIVLKGWDPDWIRSDSGAGVANARGWPLPANQWSTCRRWSHDHSNEVTIICSHEFRRCRAVHQSRCPGAGLEHTYSGKRGGLAVWGPAGNVRATNQYSTAGLGNGYNMLCRTNSQYLTYKDRSGHQPRLHAAGEHKIHFPAARRPGARNPHRRQVALGIGGGVPFCGAPGRALPASVTGEWVSGPATEWLIYSAGLARGETDPDRFVGQDHQ